MLGARAVLMPTFAEGYGLPVIEALASGAPVIASDIPVFHEIGDNRLLLIDPTDGPKWREAICDFTAVDSEARRAWLARAGGYVASDWSTHFARIEEFLTTLTR
jgi:glycosyltransferase involved in cell wall biosynthesis